MWYRLWRYLIELIESKKPLELLKKYGEQHKNKNLWTK